jgi:hypothetical protein
MEGGGGFGMRVREAFVLRVCKRRLFGTSCQICLLDESNQRLLQRCKGTRERPAAVRQKAIHGGQKVIGPGIEPGTSRARILTRDENM